MRVIPTLAQLSMGLVVAVVLLAVSAPGLLYAWGLHQAVAYPVPLRATPEAARAAWLACREELPIRVEHADPWTVLYWTFRQDIRDRPQRPVGLRMAALVARRQHDRLWPRPMNMLRWHPAYAAMSIWITRHWTAEQVAETVAAEGSCRCHVR